MDELAEMHYAANDPQFRDEEKEAQEQFLEQLSEVYEQIGNAADVLDAMKSDNRNLKLALLTLGEAMSYIEEEM